MKRTGAALEQCDLIQVGVRHLGAVKKSRGEAEAMKLEGFVIDGFRY